MGGMLDALIGGTPTTDGGRLFVSITSSWFGAATLPAASGLIRAANSTAIIAVLKFDGVTTANLLSTDIGDSLYVGSTAATSSMFVDSGGSITFRSSNNPKFSINATGVG